MVEDYENIIVSLKEKIYKLIVKLDDELLKNKVLLQEKEKVLTDLGEKEKEIALMKEQVENLKLGISIQSGTGNNHEAKIKINRMVREIDNCIALLNK